MLEALLEKFEDLFQPHDEETVRERWPEWIVTFIPEPRHGQVRKDVLKSVKVKAPENRDRIAVIVAVESLGIKGSKIDFSITSNYCNYYTIHIHKSNQVVDDEGLPMIGEFMLDATMIEEDNE